MNDDLRDVALRAAAEGAQVLAITTGGEHLTGHIEKLLHGGVEFIERRPDGRVRRTLWYADIDSMAPFEADEEEPTPDDPLDALTAQLKARAAAEREKSLAERLLTNSQRES